MIVVIPENVIVYRNAMPCEKAKRSKTVLTVSEFEQEKPKEFKTP